MKRKKTVKYYACGASMLTFRELLVLVTDRVLRDETPQSERDMLSRALDLASLLSKGGQARAAEALVESAARRAGLVG